MANWRASLRHGHARRPSHTHMSAAVRPRCSSDWRRTDAQILRLPTQLSRTTSAAIATDGREARAGPSQPATRASETPRVLKFDQELIRIEPPAIQQIPYVVVVDDEEIAGRAERPPQSRVAAQRAADGVVLDVAGH